MRGSLKNESLFFIKTRNLLDISRNLLTRFNGVFILIGYPFNKNKLVFVFIIYFFSSLIPLQASQNRDFLVIDLLVKSCYGDTKSCNKALRKINNYQKSAVINNNFSCQTRLLGLEANLIMAMNSSLKRKEVKSIIQAVKKYC